MHGRGLKMNFSQRSMIMIVIGAIFVFYGMFVIFPICYAAIGSFFDWQPMAGIFDFTGLENYKNVLSNRAFITSLMNTLLFAFLVVAFRTFLGIFFAFLINEVKHFKSWFRTVYFVPVITSVVAVSLVWQRLYDPQFGPLNDFLTSLGFGKQLFLKDGKLALIWIIVSVIWKDVGYVIILYLAGISGISSTYYEAAAIDGASKFKMFRAITWPLLKSTTAFVVITSIITYLQSFTQIFIMTDQTAGPGISTYTMMFLLYKSAFVDYLFGIASANAMFLFIIILVFSIFQLKMHMFESNE